MSRELLIPRDFPRPTCQQRVIAELERLQASIQPGYSAMLWRKSKLSPDADKQLRHRLVDARIELVLSNGLADVLRIYDFVPPLIAPFVLGSRPRSLEAATRLLALNLDWYLKPPAPFFRSNWVWDCVAVLALTWSTIRVLQSASFAMFNPGGSLGALLVSSFIWITWHGHPTRAQWLRVLCLHLRDVYGIAGPVWASELAQASLPAQPALEPTEQGDQPDDGDRG